MFFHLFIIIINSFRCINQFLHQSELVYQVFFHGFFAKRATNFIQTGTILEDTLNTHQTNAMLIVADQHGKIVLLVEGVLADRTVERVG